MKRFGSYTLAEEPHTNTPSLGWFVYRRYDQWPISENRHRSAAIAAIRRHQRTDAKGNDSPRPPSRGH